MIKMDKMINKGSFVNNFAEQFASQNVSDGNSTVKALQNKAFASFSENGLPTPKAEDWRYAKLFFLNDYNFQVKHEFKLTNDIAAGFLFEDLTANVLVFLNGIYQADFSKIIDENIDFSNLNEMFKSESPILNENYGKSFDVCNDPFLSLNTAFANDGTCLKIKKGTVCEHPIHIVQIFSGESAETASFPRNFIIAEENSHAKIIETYHKIGNETTFSAEVSEIFLDPNAILDFYKVQILPETHVMFSKTYVAQSKDSIYNDVTLTLDGKFIRNNIYDRHLGEHIETHLFGFYFASQENFIDNHTFIDHATPNCNSNEVYKGIISDSGTAVFNGKILVRPDAQKTNAYQSNKNVLLSDTATINTKPELEIYADDVKCSHGATSGSLDKEHLFYLRARGLDEDHARALLLSAFGEEIIEKIKIEQIQTILSDLFENKLSGKMK